MSDTQQELVTCKELIPLTRRDSLFQSKSDSKKGVPQDQSRHACRNRVHSIYRMHQHSLLVLGKRMKTCKFAHSKLYIYSTATHIIFFEIYPDPRRALQCTKSYMLQSYRQSSSDLLRHGYPSSVIPSLSLSFPPESQYCVHPCFTHADCTTSQQSIVAH